ncbi:4-aminobutyrate--2-oxoglutarate transaminase [Paracoccus laeviglucosivorans]|uniref:4-aminobutyrate aminotransferase apoenzyme n=1 Tax=Paracoccus laeviglucosivorans TaxID=1197861 RepID=A0A521FGK5_9RHOB|nr:4-aminobutyrate--2-oxoglutarate transaminase [Paracoccus laeviglucosivorans]SMO95255.1 4-aminobutyrate aminotransferase apoenzyme [Paracoccus laeviglucosivorans]
MTSLTDRKNAAISRGVGMTTQIYAERAENAEIWDRDGNRYIDFAAGIAVVNTGHRHPRVMQAVRDQLDRFTHTCHQVVPYENYVTLAERLNRAVPGDWPKKTAFFTTGAEAVENAVKIARHYKARPGIIAFSGAFHGRTFLGMSLTGKVQPYKAGFGPMMNDIWHLPFPNLLHGITQEDALDALDRLFRSDIDPARVAAIIIEPVQGEGGFYEAPPGFLQRLREICDQYSMLLIADEVQTGFARTGRLFAMEHHGVAADLTTMAKGLGGGLPISAVTGRADVMDSPAPGGLGGTYAGNPLAVAAALAVLDVIADEDLCARATRLGQRLKQRLASVVQDVPEIVDIRGPGFMNAMEFNVAGSDRPSPDMANRVREEALKRNLILLTCGVHGNVIRFLAPLTIPDAIFDEALDILETSIRAARA